LKTTCVAAVKTWFIASLLNSLPALEIECQLGVEIADIVISRLYSLFGILNFFT